MIDIAFRLAIFDLDGVIVDTAKYHYLAWRRLGQELGIAFTEADNERLKGVSRMRSLDILLEIGKQERSLTEKNQLAAKKNTWYVESILQMDRSEILPGVVELLTGLKSHGIKIALGSASKNAPTILERIELSGFFDLIVDGNLVSQAKPDPEVFLLATQRLQVPVNEAVVFEDAQAGIEAALRAGMFAIGVGQADLLCHAHLVIPGFQDFGVQDFLKLSKAN